MGSTKKKVGDETLLEDDEVIVKKDEDLEDDEDVEEDEENLEDDDEEEDDEEEGEEDDEDDDEDLTPEELRAKLKKQKQISNNQKIRAEKAESKLKKKAPTSKSSELSTSDVLTIVKAGVHEDDIDEVRDYAALKKLSIKEALKTSFVKTLLAEKEEERNTAEAAHIGTTRRGKGKKTAALILADAEAGNLPDDPAELAQARIDKKRADQQQRKR